MKNYDDIHNEYRRGKGIEFERVRRITGYMVGSTKTWNSAKLQELKQRVVHNY